MTLLNALSGFAGSPLGLSDDPSRVSGPAARPWGSRLRSLIPPREERHLAPSPLRARFQSQLLLPPLRFFSFRVSCLWRDIILPVLAASEPRRDFAGTVHWPPFCTGDRRGSATVVTGLDASTLFPLQPEGGAKEPPSAAWRPVTPDSCAPSPASQLWWHNLTHLGRVLNYRCLTSVPEILL